MFQHEESQQLVYFNIYIKINLAEAIYVSSLRMRTKLSFFSGQINKKQLFNVPRFLCLYQNFFLTIYMYASNCVNEFHNLLHALI